MSQPLPRFTAETERRYDLLFVQQITTSTTDAPATVERATLPGDSRRLRGIPVIAPGVQGAPNPLSVVLDRERRRKRHAA